MMTSNVLGLFFFVFSIVLWNLYKKVTRFRVTFCPFVWQFLLIFELLQRFQTEDIMKFISWKFQIKRSKIDRAAANLVLNFYLNYFALLALSLWHNAAAKPAGTRKPSRSYIDSNNAVFTSCNPLVLIDISHRKVSKICESRSAYLQTPGREPRPTRRQTERPSRSYIEPSNAVIEAWNIVYWWISRYEKFSY